MGYALWSLTRKTKSRVAENVVSTMQPPTEPCGPCGTPTLPAKKLPGPWLTPGLHEVALEHIYGLIRLGMQVSRDDRAGGQAGEDRHGPGARVGVQHPQRHAREVERGPRHSICVSLHVVHPRLPSVSNSRTRRYICKGRLGLTILAYLILPELTIWPGPPNPDTWSEHPTDSNRRESTATG
jgi:hypothetical protein